MMPSWSISLTWLTPGRDKKARYLSVRFQHPPRLEPDLRLSPHPAQHPEIVLSLCSVTIGADNLDIAYAVCILGIFEPGAGYDVITMHLAGMEWDSLALTIGAIDCAHGPFERDGFIP
jgi:hypothetical protein